MKKTTHINIEGMDCASCVVHIEGDLKGLDGVEDASVSLPLKSGAVTFDDAKVSEADLLESVRKSGYEAEMADGSDDMSSHADGGHGDHVRVGSDRTVRDKLIRLIVSATLSVVILSLGFVWKIEQGMEVMMLLSLVILVYCGQEFFRRGIPNLLKGRPGMDTLVALGVGAAFLYSSYLTLFIDTREEYFMDVAIITTFILFGRYLEERAKGQAGAAIKKLLELSAKIAHRVTDGGTEDVPLEQVVEGDLLRVKPGEKIPTDGVIVEGHAAIDESMVTGESIPVDRGTGDAIIGATLNGNTAFMMRATKVGAETVLSQIVKTVREAQMHKPPIQKLVDVIAGYFTWGVIAVAVLTFAGWTFWGGGSAFVPTVAVLIIACPCALGLATPISIVVGSGKGAQIGVLIKKPESLEKAHKITAFAFDKTGTVTKGKPEVQEYLNIAGDESRNRAVALALESMSEHPLARSVVRFVSDDKPDLRAQEVRGFEAVTGKGVRGEVGDMSYHFGSGDYMDSVGVMNDDVRGDIGMLEEKGFTVLSLSDDRRVLALFAVRDGVKESSARAIGLLKKRGIRTIMITGDNERVAKAIAEEVGIDEVHSRVTPERKSEVIAELQARGEFVAMVGDGINDSPALAKADVGIAMGTGTDVAIETGDIVLVKGDLMKAVEAIELSRATLRNIKQNLFWAFVYNTVGIPLAAFGLLNPAFSAAAMALSSVSVVTNALRLKRFRA